MKRKQFLIGDFRFEIRFSEDITIPEHFLLFERPLEEAVETETRAGDADSALYLYEIMPAEKIAEPKGRKIIGRDDIAIYATDAGEMRLIGIRGSSDFYASYEEVSETHAVIYMKKSSIGDLIYDTVFTSLLALERRMIVRDGIVLHCAYMCLPGKKEAVLFSAPSETGKTTQANLWEKYRGSRTVNGDRSLLKKDDGVWTAHGWPVCGSSEVCHNENIPIKAIVMLSQAKTDTIERLSPMRAFSQVYSQITINRWNQEAHNHAMDLIEQLVTEVPIWHLACTISEEAVRCLENVL